MCVYVCEARNFQSITDYWRHHSTNELLSLTTRNTNLNVHRDFKTNASKLSDIFSFSSGTLEVYVLWDVQSLYWAIHPRLWYHYLLTFSTEQNYSSEANSSSPSQEIPNNLAEPEGPLPRLQQPLTCPNPEPDQSSPCPPFPTHSLKDPSRWDHYADQNAGHQPLSDEAQYPIRSQNWNASAGLCEDLSLITKQSGQSVSNVTPQT